jgi:hypothetical protein
MYDFGWAWKLLSAIKIMSVMDTLEPPTTLSPASTRLQIALAIAYATDDVSERAELVSFARWESNFETAVLDCRKRGGGFSLGPWQVVPFTSPERTMLCSDLVGSAKLALARMKLSKQYCKRLPEKHRYSQYATGSCTHAQGPWLSEVRWKTAKKVEPLLTEELVHSVTE